LQSGKEKTLFLKDLYIGEQVSDKYKFKYFEDFQGNIGLPEGFEPQEVVVELIPEGNKPKIVEERYSWNTVAS
jgi:hypothetical protein